MRLAFTYIRHANVRGNWNFSLDQKRRRVTCPLLCVFYWKQWKVHEYTRRSWNDKNCMFPAKSWQIVIDYSVFVWREFDLFLKIRSITSWRYFYSFVYVCVWHVKTEIKLVRFVVYIQSVPKMWEYRLIENYLE